MITVNFNTETLEEREAGGLMAMLLVLHPNAALAAQASLDALPVSDDRDTSDARAAFAAPYTGPGVSGEIYAGSAPSVTATVPDAPTTTAAPPPPPAAETAPPEAGQPTLDSEGLPWDERIHASSKAVNADGTWRAKRNVAPGLVHQIKAELRGAVSSAPEVATQDPAAVFSPPPPPATDTIPAPPPAADAPPPPAADAPPPPPAPPPATETAPAPTPAAGAATFADVMKLTVDLQKAGKLTIEDTTSFCKSLGIENMRDLAGRADLIPAFHAILANLD